jgi:hypothetical protein
MFCFDRISEVGQQNREIQETRRGFIPVYKQTDLSTYKTEFLRILRSRISVFTNCKVLGKK